MKTKAKEKATLTRFDKFKRFVKNILHKLCWWKKPRFFSITSQYYASDVAELESYKTPLTDIIEENTVRLPSSRDTFQWKFKGEAEYKGVKEWEAYLATEDKFITSETHLVIRGK